MSVGSCRFPIVVRSIDHVAIVVPARDERDRIAESLVSILAAVGALAGVCSTQIVVVADRCSDDTAEVAARQLRPGDRIVLSSAGCVGEARRIGVEFVRSDGYRPERTWIAGTDADTVVPIDWLSRQLAHADRGAMATAGRVRLRADGADAHGPDPTIAGIEERFRISYRASAQRRPHIHGANIGVRMDTYLAVGGWRSIATGEDHDLWRRIVGAGSVVVHDGLSIVETSARTRGRAPDGFAADLARLESRP